MSDPAIVYMDNAATSWPKPPAVAAAMCRYIEEIGANAGRSGHRLSVTAGRQVEDCRERLAGFFGLDDPFRVVFTKNVTEAINLVLQGMLSPGDHVVTSAMEHNSVMRPLRSLEAEGVELSVVPCSPAGELDPGDALKAIRPDTRMVVINHVSNVCGSILPVEEIGRLARERDIPLLVDAAASAGALPLDLASMPVDLLAFTGHKSLLGPPGTGGLVLGPDFDAERIRPLIRGGTGSRSEKEEQPDFLPDRFEAGTLNIVGLAGLDAGLAWLQERGLDTLRREQVLRLQRLLDGLSAIGGVEVLGPGRAERMASALAFRLKGLSPSEVGLRLDEEFGILCRVGLHCAPAAHRTLGSFPEGCLRFAPGPFSSDEDIDRSLEAVDSLAREASHG